jgi:hypothetical protein
MNNIVDNDRANDLVTQVVANKDDLKNIMISNPHRQKIK